MRTMSSREREAFDTRLNPVPETAAAGIPQRNNANCERQEDAICDGPGNQIHWSQAVLDVQTLGPSLTS